MSCLGLSAAAQGVEADTSAFYGIRAQLDAGASGAALQGISDLAPRLLATADPGVAAEASLLLGDALAANGRHQDGLDAYERARATAEAADDVLRQGRAYHGLAEGLLALDRFQEAAVHFGAAAELYAADSNRHVVTLRAQSRAYLLAGRGQEARRAAVESAEVAEAAGLVAEQAESLRLAAATSASMGQHDLAYRTLRRAELLQEANFEARLEEQRTDLEQTLLAALAAREAERALGDERAVGLLEAEQQRWRRKAAMGMAALTLGALGMTLLLWGLTGWRRYRIRSAVRHHQRKRRRRLRSQRPVSGPTARDLDALPSVAPNTATPLNTSPGVGAVDPRPRVSPKQVPPHEDRIETAPRARARTASEHLGTSGDALPDASQSGGRDAQGPVGEPFVRPQVTTYPNSEALSTAVAERLMAAAATAPEGLDAKSAPRRAPGDTEETGLALAAFLLDQQLGGGGGAPDRSQLLGRSEVLRLLRHRVARQGVEIDMQGFLEAVGDYVLLRRGSLATGVKVQVNAVLRVPVRYAAPLGLIAYELVLNAIEHAFVGRQTGVVTLRMDQEAGHVHLEIEDDGRGLPQGFSLERSGTEGLRFVRALAGFLRAAVEVRSRAGVRWRFSVGTDSA